jgi:hypothetical protein
LYPEGHFGFTAVTFLVVLPLTQVIVVFRIGAGAAAGAAAVSCVNFTLIVGAEKVKFFAEI